MLYRPLLEISYMQLILATHHHNDIHQRMQGR